MTFWWKAFVGVMWLLVMLDSCEIDLIKSKVHALEHNP